MSKIIILVVFGLLSSIIFSNACYAFTPAPQSDPSLKSVSLQLEVRDSNNNLVAYLEPDIMYITNITMLHKYLDTIHDRTIITIDGKKYEQVEWTNIQVLSAFGQYSSYVLADAKGTSLIYMTHEGYIGEPGDSVLASWKIVEAVG